MAWNMITEFIKTVNPAAGPAIDFVKDLMRSKSSRKLDDKELTSLLGLAAYDSYSLSGKYGTKGRLELRESQPQNSELKNICNDLQCGLYEITHGKHQGKTILAYRGTDLSDAVSAGVTLIQDISLAFPGGLVGEPIRSAIRVAVKIAEDWDPDFICGHSLGGLIAECVCSATGIPGASFNAPGPRGHLKDSNDLLIGDKYIGVEFEVHLTLLDPVSSVGSILGADLSHVGDPIMHPGASHSMKVMLEDLEK